MKRESAILTLLLGAGAMSGGSGIPFLSPTDAAGYGVREATCQHGLIDDAPDFGWTLGHGQQLGIRCPGPGTVYRVGFFVEFLLVPGTVEIVIFDDGVEVSRTAVPVPAPGLHEFDLPDVPIAGDADIVLCPIGNFWAVTGEDFTTAPFTATYLTRGCIPAGNPLLNNNLVIYAVTDDFTTGVEESSIVADRPPILSTPCMVPVRIRLLAQSESPVEIVFYNIAGRQAKRLFRDRVPAGEFEVAWDGRSDSGEEAPAGVYFVRTRIGSSLHTAKLTLVR